MIKKLLLVTVALAVFAGTACAPRPVIGKEYGPRLDAIEERLAEIQIAVDSLKTEVNRANANDEILNENMERLYGEVDELREKMGMPRSKPRKELVK